MNMALKIRNIKSIPDIKNIICLLTVISGCLMMMSCHHKDLVFESDRVGHITVVFDWRYAPDANPSSMAFYLHNHDDGNSLRYIFQNNTGGSIKVPGGLYRGLCLNADLTDWAVISNEDDADNFEISTTDSNILPAAGFPTRSIPRGPDAENERMASTPGMLWAHTLPDISIPEYTKDKTITMYPAEKVCHYTVDVYNSGDVSRYAKSGIDATLSGMSEGYLIGKDTQHEYKVTHPFLLKPDVSHNSLHAEFLTFGESPASDAHYLSIYLIREDGKSWNGNVNVTDQVKNAPDPHHVHIIVSGLDLPNPISGGSGIIPNVNDWETVNINLKM